MPALNIILASRSVRRAQLLHEAGIPYRQIDPPFADPPSPPEVTSHLGATQQFRGPEGCCVQYPPPPPEAPPDANHASVQPPALPGGTLSHAQPPALPGGTSGVTSCSLSTCNPAALSAAAHLTIQLAIQKALSCLHANLGPQANGDQLLAADTVVVDPAGRLLGQPQGTAAARDMLNSLLGKSHHVVTGVALITRDPQPKTTPSPHPGLDKNHSLLSFADSAAVHFEPVSQDELEQYLASNSWQGKAGGYNLAELEHRWPVTIQGDPATVVGLPMRKLLDYWQRQGLRPSPPPKRT
ncbi:MAG: Maf family protein [Phycisphaeraceae bacterium]|nr:Maf family protein [Phycisphaeraceae bacterium]